MTPKLKKYERQNIRRRFHCDPDEYVAALERQNGVCAICSEPGRHRLRADTFRTDGVIALVCFDCFHMLEVIVKKIEKLAVYLATRKV